MTYPTISMVDVINAGARPSRHPHPKPCPGCGMHPDIDRAFYGRVVVYCDNDSCAGIGDRWHQVMGDTVAEAVEKWNAAP